MAKFDGIFEIQGTLKGMTFYRSKNGQLIRVKGGVSKKRIQNDPAFQRTRENGLEFAHCAKMGQLFRRTTANLLIHAKDHLVSSRLLKEMSKIKNLDGTSARGNRQVHIGFQQAEAKEVLKGFNFNERSVFASTLKVPVALNTATGEMTITDFDPSQHLRVPESTSHVSLSTAMCLVDWENDTFETEHGARENLPISPGTSTITLAPRAVPSGGGTMFYLILIEFFQEINGIQYPLKNQAYNVLYVMEVL